MTALEFQYELSGLQENLMRFAYSLTSDTENAKDLFQDTCLKALIYHNKFLYGTNIKAWTYTIMKNTFINNYRRGVRQKENHDNTREYILLNQFKYSSAENPDSAYTAKEIEKIIETLDDNFRLPFKMHYEGFKYKEIADNLKMKIGTVKSRIFFARKTLMKELET
jgi:RNA polymerase sigma-70 factor, ECF subfamily